MITTIITLQSITAQALLFRVFRVYIYKVTSQKNKLVADVFKELFQTESNSEPIPYFEVVQQIRKKKSKKQRKNFKSTIKPKLYIHISAKIALIAQLCLYCYRVMIIGPGQATQQERAAAFLAQQIGHGRTKTAGAGWCCLGQGLFHMNCAIELWGVR